MKKNKINKKACTNCGLEAAVARKVCNGCNTPFYTKRPTYFYETKEGESSGSSGVGASSSNTGTNSNTNEDGSRRRTERVKREKPHFYDASEFQNKNKKKKTDKNSPKSLAAKQSKSLAAQLNKKEKKRLKEIKLRESLAEAEDERIYESIMTPEKAHQLAVILEELNNKMVISAWKPS
ncbi:UPF0547 protein C16orf87 homolog [Planococcus citri]|uniref:UPF0547 protein C16orf87 homolog n=1 Tax=Planococcus citri TaxID=170843 RepID=UPI0031F7EB2D